MNKAALNIGLTTEEVNEKIEKGLINKQTDNLTRSVEEIVKDNIFTLFNMLNLVLALIILFMGDWKNSLFIGVAISNTAIGIYQELKFKKTIDELSIMTENKVRVIRDGEIHSIKQDELVLDDVIILSSGNQVPADGLVLKSENLEIDESLLTGESDQILKQQGDKVLSGSFVTSGKAFIKIESVGLDNYATKLSMEAKEEKNKQSKLMKTLNNIIRVLTFIIVPLGLLLFYSSYTKGEGFRLSVLGSTAAMLGMIPEGLILLTSVTFAVGAMNLAKYNTLVQSLPSIETLARVDVLCLDKTGTITDGELTVEHIIPLSNMDSENLKKAISELIYSADDDNPTAKAIKRSLVKSESWILKERIPFSSKRKFSGAVFEDQGSFLLGAPEFLFQTLDKKIEDEINKYANMGLRVLALGYSSIFISDYQVPNDLECLGIIVLSDNMRPNAVDTFNFFTDEGVELKVISGDSPITVSNIAQNAKIPGADRYIDMSKVDDNADFKKLAEEYTVFGRVSPYQKRELVRGLQANEKTVCMTGDGVNDVLALKEADCGVAMVGGSDAARSVADFVLLNHDFSSMVEVLKEGRRVINNIENVASLYLIKTIYSTILSILFIYLPFAYPFSPLQMGPVNSLTVGVPSFFLALEPNYKKPEGRFINNVLENSVPAAIIVVLNILILQLAGVSFNLSHMETSTMAVLLTGVVGFIVLIKVSRPLNWKKNTMLVGLITAFLFCFTVLRDFFNFESLFTRNVFFYLPLIFASSTVFTYLNSFVVFVESKYSNLKKKLNSRKK